VRGKNKPPRPVRRPSLIFIHDSGQSKEELIPRLEAAARRGFVAASIDNRFHGGRAGSPSALKSTMLAAWRGGGKAGAPLLLDSLWDLLCLVDLLCLRADVDPRYVGCQGVGQTGATLACQLVAIDIRVCCGSGLLGCVNVGWGLTKGACWADTLGCTRSTGCYLGLQQACKLDQHLALSQVVSEVAGTLSLPGGELTAEVAEEVYNRLAPGLLGLLDLPRVLAMAAPRPVCVLAGELDDACPVEGVEEAVAEAVPWYRMCSTPEGSVGEGSGKDFGKGADLEGRLKLLMFENVQDVISVGMHCAADDWADRWLLYGGEDPELARAKLAGELVEGMCGGRDTQQPGGGGQVMGFQEDVARVEQIKQLLRTREVSGEWI